MLMNSFILLILFQYAVFLSFGDVHKDNELYNVINSCINEKLQNKKFRNHSSDLFSLHYGEPVVEVFYVLSSHDIKSIEYLTECVQYYNPTDFNPFIDSKNEVTNLTNTFQSILPNIKSKILNGFKQAIEEAEWNINHKHIDIKNIRYISRLSNNRMMTLNEYKEELQNTYNNIGFSIGSNSYSTNEDKIINKINNHKDFYDNIRNQMISSDSLYIGYILLSDRFDFNGGSVYVDKLKQSGKSISEDVYDDDISPDTIHGHQLYLVELKKHSVQGKLYDEYTPEKGEMLVIDNIVKHYLSPINKGKQDYLLIEFDLSDNCVKF